MQFQLRDYLINAKDQTNEQCIWQGVEISYQCQRMISNQQFGK